MAAAKGAKRMAPAEIYEDDGKRLGATGRRNRGSRVPTLVWLLLLLGAVAGGAYGGYEYALSRGEAGPHFGSLGGQTTLTEAELDEPVASYAVDGEVFEVSAREAILQQSSLEVARVEEGVYAMPSTESAISAARSRILQAEVDRRGITVSDEELDAYVSETFGTTDYVALASEYHMDEENVRRLLRGSAGMAKLREQVLAEATTVADDAEPVAPTQPEDGDSSKTSAEYADYIISLAGDEWDSAQGGWASFDGPYAAALREYDVRADSASYAAAEVAFNLAYERYHSAAKASSSPQSVWTDYVNGLLCQAELATCTLGQ